MHSYLSSRSDLIASPELVLTVAELVFDLKNTTIRSAARVSTTQHTNQDNMKKKTGKAVYYGYSYGLWM